MSLLMDALKRAEQAKRSEGDEGAQPKGELQLEPAPPAKTEIKAPASPLPDLNSRLDSVETELKAAATDPLTQPGQGRGRPKGADARAQAQNVLATGAASAANAAPKASSTRRITAIVSVGALAAAGVGGYFYWQLQSISQGGNRLAAPGLASTNRSPLPPPTPVTAMAPALNAPVATAPNAGDTAPAVAVGQPSGAVPSALAASTVSPSARQNLPTAEKPPAIKATRSTAKPAVTGSPSRLTPAAATAGISNAKAGPSTTMASAMAAPTGPEPLKISSQSQDSLVLRGYDALQGGRFAEAKTAYTQALRADPRDVDALLGLASLARRDGDNGLAGDYYERVLRNDPRNSAAHAGLIALQGGGDLVQAESRLKSLINLQQSDAGATSSLNFALGNLYSAQRRWPEAQQAYFTAHTADAGNPDTLYNLAISLEHLGQNSLARQLYEQALQAGRQRTAAFDRAIAQQRLSVLTR